MYSDGYKKLFWGIALATFDFNRGNINIIPDFIGYMVIVSGLSTLSSQHEYFNKARTPAVFLAILSIIDIYHSPVSQYINIYTGIMFPVAALVSMVIVVLNVFFAYCVCGAIQEIGESEGGNSLSSRANIAIKIYIAVSVFLFVVLPVSYMEPRTHVGIAVAMRVMSILINLMLMWLVNSAGSIIGRSVLNK